MVAKKLISIRVDADTLAAIDDYCKSVRFWRRSAVINNLLGNLVVGTEKADFSKLATYWPKSERKIKISLETSSM